MCEEPKDPTAPSCLMVIESYEFRGVGIEDDPGRNVARYHTTEGDFLAERDPCAILSTPGEDRKRREEESRRRAVLTKALRVAKQAVAVREAWERLPASVQNRIPMYFCVPMADLKLALELLKEHQADVPLEEMRAEVEGYAD